MYTELCVSLRVYVKIEVIYYNTNVTNLTISFYNKVITELKMISRDLVV